MAIKKDSIQYMREYLKYALEFEKYVYIWSHAMNEVNRCMRQIYSERKRLEGVKQSAQNSLSGLDNANERQIKSKEKECERSRKKAKSTTATVFVVLILLFLAGCLLGFTVLKEPNVTSAIPKSAIVLILGLATMVIMSLFTGFLPICIGIITSNKSKAKRLEAEIHDLRRKSSMRRQEIILKERASTAEEEWLANTAAEQTIIQRQDEIQAALQSAKNNLTQIYSENVLPAKYRSFNSVATLYEYLETGRCNTIQGHGGIYDTYENDLRMGLIIETLSDIRDSMYRIEANQQMLYREMQQANRTLASINSSLSKIEITNAEIAKNTAISAEANRQTAAATQWLAWNAWARGY